MRWDQFTVMSQEAIQSSPVPGRRAGPPGGPARAPAGGAFSTRTRTSSMPCWPRSACRRGQTPARTSKRRSSRAAQGQRGRGDGPLRRPCARSSTRPAKEAEQLKDEYVSTEHLFLAMVKEGTGEAGACPKAGAGVFRGTVLKALAAIRGTQRSPIPNRRASTRPWRNTPATSQTWPAGKTRPGHRPGRRDPARDPGTLPPDEKQPRPYRRARRRKTAIVEGLAQRIVTGDVPNPLKNKRLVALDMGASRRGEIPGRVRGPAQGRHKEITVEGEIILFIDELHTLVGRRGGRGRHGRLEHAQTGAGPGELHCVGATTLNEYQKYIEKDAALERRFQPVYVGEPSVEDTDLDPPGPQGEVRGPPRRPDPGRGPGCRGDPVAPLHHRPVPAGQGHRPYRRGGLAPPDRDRLHAGEIDEMERRSSSSRSSGRR